MKAMIGYIAIFGMLTVHSSSLSADTIVLKDGRRIEAEQVWLEGEMVRYKKFGTIIGLSKGKVARVIRENPSVPQKAVDFGFDHWQLGMPIGEVMAVAERNDVPLHREGLVSSNKHFNPQMCRPYIDTHSRFEYRQPLLGYPAEVTLVFTPKSRCLAYIKVHLAPNLTASDPAPNDTVMTMMREKYGQPRKLSRNLLQKNACQWRLSEQNTINLVSGANWTDLVYENATWKGVLQREEAHFQEVRRKVTHMKNVGKF